MDCLILAAGYGSRLRPLTQKIPKPILPIGKIRLLDNSVRIAKQLGLNPIVATGYRNQQVIEYLESKNLKYYTINNPSTNLLETIALGAEYVKSENFMWIGGAMFFDNSNDLKNLLKTHIEMNPFCSLFSQSDVTYTPKLIFENNKLVKFVVGSENSIYSSPTTFIVKRDFIKYCKNHNEYNVFQEAINANETFNIINLSGASLEIHNINDYLKIHKKLLPNGYLSADSLVKNSETISSYIYNSNCKNSLIHNSLIINSTISDIKIKNSMFFENQKIFSI